MPQFKVSVIIPVYNAEKFLRQAVESAVALDSVGEVLLVEDRSPDNALQVCKILETEFAKVRVLQHPGGKNRGAGASRNLGIERASFEFVAFLDADDWYLPNRFEKENQLFEDRNVDGVYGATGFFYSNTQMLDKTRLTTITNPPRPENLLKVLLQPKAGRFHTNAITVRKTLFSKTGLFDVTLALHQDTHLWLRLAHFGKLVPGITNQPISIRRVHSSNRIAHKNTQTRHLLYKKVFNAFQRYSDLPKHDLRLIFRKYVGSVSPYKPIQVIYGIGIMLRKPALIKKIL